MATKKLPLTGHHLHKIYNLPCRMAISRTQSDGCCQTAAVKWHFLCKKEPRDACNWKMDAKKLSAKCLQSNVTTRLMASL